MRLTDLDKLVNFHDRLNPALWYNGKLRPEVREKLMRIALTFVKFINVKNLKLRDLTLSGSNASFNYNDTSDIDLHLIADSSGPCKADIQELFLAKKGLFNDQHDISIRDHDVEVYVQDADQTHISNGVYSVYQDRWLKQPKKITANPDTSNIEDKYNYLHNAVDQAVNSGDAETINKLKDKIKKMRQTGLESSGEYGVENLTFKLLRNDGSMDRLWDAGMMATDRALSLDK